MTKHVTRRSDIDPEVESFLRSLDGMPPATSVDEMRERELAMQVAHSGVAPAATDQWTVDSPHGPVVLNIVRPAGHSGALTPVIYLHGGGWVVGEFRTHERLLRDLAHAANAA